MGKNRRVERLEAELDPDRAQLCAEEIAIHHLAGHSLESNDEWSAIGNAGNVMRGSHFIVHPAPANRIEQLFGARRVEGRHREIRGVRKPDAGGDGCLRHSPFAEQHPLQELLAVERVGEGATDTNIAKPGTVEIEPERHDAVAAAGVHRTLNEPDAWVSAQALPLGPRHGK